MSMHLYRGESIAIAGLMVLAYTGEAHSHTDSAAIAPIAITMPGVKPDHFVVLKSLAQLENAVLALARHKMHDTALAQGPKPIGS
jgi:hypothetical protein